MNFFGAIISGLFFLAGLYMGWQSLKSVFSWVKMPATVIENRAETKIKKGQKKIRYRHIVKFVTKNGEQVTAESPIKSSSQYPEGKALNIYYNPTDPSKIKIANFGGLILFPLVFSALGLTGIILSIMGKWQ